ncbi:hypothetical protein AGLY_014537 [Aphis glycines]|uniref:Uncharacterized protein n=1 Tax=Aphis glycines TaxID=307491 RepID=A0A6G0T3B1_APHGL|nr:hypothetical protein AGLY_014537 [Aphis glycines]
MKITLILSFGKLSGIVQAVQGLARVILNVTIMQIVCTVQLFPCNIEKSKQIKDCNNNKNEMQIHMHYDFFVLLTLSSKPSVDGVRILMVAVVILWTPEDGADVAARRHTAGRSKTEQRISVLLLLLHLLLLLLLLLLMVVCLIVRLELLLSRIEQQATRRRVVVLPLHFAGVVMCVVVVEHGSDRVFARIVDLHVQVPDTDGGEHLLGVSHQTVGELVAVVHHPDGVRGLQARRLTAAAGELQGRRRRSHKVAAVAGKTRNAPDAGQSGPHFDLDAARVRVRAQRPEPRFLDAHHGRMVPVQPGVARVQRSPLVVQLDGRAHHEHAGRVPEQSPHRGGHEHGDEYRTHGVRAHPPESSHQQRRDDHAHAAQRVGQDVQQHALHQMVLVVLPRAGRRGRRTVRLVSAAAAAHRYGHLLVVGVVSESVMTTAVVTVSVTASTAVAVPMTATTVAVPVTTSTTVTVPVATAVLEHVYADQVDEQPKHADHEQAVVMHLGRFYCPFHGFRQYEKRYEQQEQRVDESGQHFGPLIAVGVRIVGRPPADHLGREPGHQAGAIEEHVKRVRYQTQAVRPHAVSKFHESEHKV